MTDPTDGGHMMRRRPARSAQALVPVVKKILNI